MSAAHNGGPAFPVPGLQNDEDFNGMTLRDYFAVHADIGDVDQLSQQIGASLTGRPCPDWAIEPHGCLSWWAEYRAIVRYIEADAILKERTK